MMIDNFIKAFLKMATIVTAFIAMVALGAVVLMIQFPGILLFALRVALIIFGIISAVVLLVYSLIVAISLLVTRKKESIAKGVA